jgi:hypothetical protein
MPEKEFKSVHLKMINDLKMLQKNNLMKEGNLLKVIDEKVSNMHEKKRN